MMRGCLCRSCNVREGFAGIDTYYDRYRDRNPGYILNVQFRYFDPFLGRNVESELPISLEEKAHLAEMLAARFFGPTNAEEADSGEP